MVTILSRIVEATGASCGAGAVSYEPDPRHVEIAMKELGLDAPGTETVATLGVKTAEELDDTPLGQAGATKFRSVTMRLAFLALGLPRLLYCTKEAARRMQKPTKGAWAKLKRIGRFLRGQPRCVQWLRWQREVEGVDGRDGLGPCRMPRDEEVDDGMPLAAGRGWSVALRPHRPPKR